jgi:hypothetical protein
MMIDDDRHLASYGVQSDSVVQLEDPEDVHHSEFRTNVLEGHKNGLVIAVEKIQQEIQVIREIIKGSSDSVISGADAILRTMDCALHNVGELGVHALEIKCTGLVEAIDCTNHELQQAKHSFLPRAVNNVLLGALELKTQGNIAESERILSDLEKVRQAFARAAIESLNRNLAMENDRLRENLTLEVELRNITENSPSESGGEAKAALEVMAAENHRLGGEVDNLEVEVAKPQAEEVEVAKLQAEVNRLQQLLVLQEREAAHEKHILENALDLSSRMLPEQEEDTSTTSPEIATTFETPMITIPEAQVQLSPRAPGKRGFAIDWERNNEMDPYLRLKEAQLAVQNLQSDDMHKPSGASLLYLEAALQRAAILAFPPSTDMSSPALDRWHHSLQAIMSNMDPKKALQISPEKIATARKIEVSKDDTTMSSEYSNVAETIENWNQALMAEAELSAVVEGINKSRREVLEIRRGNIDEIRSNNNPTPMVHGILLAVMTTMNCDSRKGGWKTMKKRMAKGSIFLREIFEFDVTQLKASHVKATKNIFAKRPDDFVPEVIAKKGSAALPPLFKWVMSMTSFFDQVQRLALYLS